MADNLNKKAILEIDLDVDALNQEAAIAKQRVADLTKEMRDLKKAGQDNTAQYIALQGQQKSFNQVVQTATNINKQLTTAQRAATGSITEMRSQLSLVTAQYNSLSAAERTNAEIGGKLLTHQKGLSDSLKELEAAGGNTSRQFADYEGAIKRALGSMNPFESQLGAIVQGYNSLTAAIADNTAKQAAKIVADETAAAAATQLTEANLAVAAAEERVAVAEAQVTELTTANTVSSEALTAANAQLAETSLALAAAQETQAAATTASGVATERATIATESASKGFKLFDTVLKASVIGAIAGIILLLINYLKTFDPLVDAVEQAFAGLNAAVQFVAAALKNAFLAFQNIGNVMQNIGNFFTHPLDSIKAFGAGMVQAAKDAAKLKEAEQDLADAMRISEVATAEAAQRVSALILQARNRSLSVADRKKLLDEAAKLDQTDYERRTALAQKELDNAVENARINGQLNKQQIEAIRANGVTELTILQNNSKLKGKITDSDIDKFKKAQLDIIAIRQESTNRQEKIQNKIDADAEKAEKAEEARLAKQKDARDKAQKQDDLRVQAEEKTRALQQSGREADLIKLNVDYDKRVQASRGFARTIAAIEKERLAALSKLRADWAKEDEKQQAANNLTAANAQIAAIQRENKELLEARDGFSQEAQDQLIANYEKIRTIRETAIANQRSFELAQANLTKEQIDAITQKFDAEDLANNQDFADQKAQIQKDLSAKRVEYLQSELDATTAIEQQKRAVYAQGLDTLTQIFSKQTILGKAAFIAQKALAVAEIVISTQKQVAAIELAAAYASASAFLQFGFIGGLAAVAAIETTAAIKATIAEISGAISIAAIVGQAISGFAKGGIYNSDGKGGLLPGYSKTDNVNSRLRSGEAVVVSEAMQDPKARSIVSAINVAYGGRAFDAVNSTGGFATGGVFDPALNFGNDLSQLERVIERTALAVANNTPRQVLVIEDVQLSLNDKAAQVSKSTI